MASYAHLVRRNFGYQLAQISPTNTDISRRFAIVDRLRLDADEGNTTGRARDFTVRWLGSDEDMQPTDMYRREAWHDYELRVAYPTCIGGEEDMQDIILQDRHQVIERLRDSTYRVGYDASNSSTAIGLLNRYRTGDELIDSRDVWQVVSRWRCLIREDI